VLIDFTAGEPASWRRPSDTWLRAVEDQLKPFVLSPPSRTKLIDMFDVQLLTQLSRDISHCAVKNKCQIEEILLIIKMSKQDVPN